MPKPPRAPIPSKPKRVEPISAAPDNPHDADRWVQGRKSREQKITVRIDVDLYMALKYASVHTNKSLVVLVSEWVEREFSEYLPKKK